MEDPQKIEETFAQDLDLCWLSEDPAVLEKLFRNKLAEATSVESEGLTFRAEMLTQIARAEAAQSKLSDASVTLDTAAKILNEMAQAAPVTARIRLLLEEGRLQILMRTPSQARTRFATAWPLAVSAGEDFFIVDIARMMAEIEPMKLQEEWLRRAIETAERSSQAKARQCLGALYADLGWRLFDLRQFEASLQTHQRSLATYQKLGPPSGALRARWAIGRLLRQLNRLSEALAMNEALLLETNSDAPLYGRLCEETAECFMALKRPEAAQNYFARAYQELSRSTRIPDRHPVKLKRLKDLGKVE